MPSSTLLELVKLPDSRAIHLWADYVELRCLTDPDLRISKADVMGYVQKRKDLRRGLDDYASADRNFDAENRPSELPADIRRAATMADVFEHLEYRAIAFNDFYPFVLSKDGNILSRKHRMTLKRKLYIFLLLSSSERYVNEQYRNKLANAFEVASLTALRCYLPDWAKVHLFGTNPLNKEGRYPGGQLLKRIRRLVEDLGEEFTGKESEFKHTGDNGLDVVGWIPLGDRARGFLLVFGQCACSDDEWPQKQHSSSAQHWDDVIKFKVPPVNITFIPFCYRLNTGDWHTDSKIEKGTILVDRLRLTKLLGECCRSLEWLPHYDLVNKAINQQALLV